MTFDSDEEMRAHALDLAIRSSYTPGNVVHSGQGPKIESVIERARAYYDFMIEGHDKAEAFTNDNVEAHTAKHRTEIDDRDGYRPVTIKVPKDLYGLGRDTYNVVTGNSSDLGGLVDKVLAAMDRVGDKGTKR